MTLETAPKRVFELVLPVKPVGKGRPRFVRATGRTYTPEKTVSFEAQVRWFLINAEAPRFEGAVVVEIECFFEKPKSHPKKGFRFCIGSVDWDNLGKGVCDAANGILWSDDRNIVSGKVTKRYGDAPKIILRVRDASPEDVHPLQLVEADK